MAITINECAADQSTIINSSEENNMTIEEVIALYRNLDKEAKIEIEGNVVNVFAKEDSPIWEGI